MVSHLHTAVVKPIASVDVIPTFSCAARTVPHRCYCCCCPGGKNRSDLCSAPCIIRTCPTDADAFRGRSLTTQKENKDCLRKTLHHRDTKNIPEKKKPSDSQTLWATCPTIENGKENSSTLSQQLLLSRFLTYETKTFHTIFPADSSRLGKQVVKREHPLEPLTHLVDDKGVGGRGSHMGRTASVATATALRGLGTSRKGDETAQKMLAMFTNPKEYADYLTSPRYFTHSSFTS